MFSEWMWARGPVSVFLNRRAFSASGNAAFQLLKDLPVHSVSVRRLFLIYVTAIEAVVCAVLAGSF